MQPTVIGFPDEGKTDPNGCSGPLRTHGSGLVRSKNFRAKKQQCQEYADKDHGQVQASAYRVEVTWIESRSAKHGLLLAGVVPNLSLRSVRSPAMKSGLLSDKGSAPLALPARRERSTLHVAIVGDGTIGCLMAWLLHQRGHSVYLKTNGVQNAEFAEELGVRILHGDEGAEAFDLVFETVGRAQEESIGLSGGGDSQ